MKTLKIIISFCLLLSFISCDSDDSETTPVDEQSIIGTWSVIELEADAEISTDFAGTPFTTNTTSVGENFDYTIVFTEDTFTAVGGYDLVTTGTLNGIPIDTDRQSITGVDETGTYNLNIDEGIIEIDGSAFDFEANGTEFSEFSEDQELNIAFDNNGNLVLTQEIETVIEEDGIELSTAIDARIVLSRN